MLAADAEFGLAGHLVDLLAHLVERGIDAVALGLGILGDGMLDQHSRLVEDGSAPAARERDAGRARPDKEGGSETAGGAAVSTSGRQAPDVETTQASRQQQHAPSTEQRGMAANVIGEVFALSLSAFTGEWVAWQRAWSAICCTASQLCQPWRMAV